jgi:hypothetical protein
MDATHARFPDTNIPMRWRTRRLRGTRNSGSYLKKPVCTGFFPMSGESYPVDEFTRRLERCRASLGFPLRPQARSRLRDRRRDLGILIVFDRVRWRQWSAIIFSRR